MKLKPFVLNSVAAIALASATALAGAADAGETGAGDAAIKAGQPSQSAAPLESVADPKQALKSADVKSADGQEIGKVQAVLVDKEGKPDKINVELASDIAGGEPKTVAIEAEKLSFDPGQKIILAQLTPDEIKALPAVKKSQPAAKPSGDDAGKTAPSPKPSMPTPGGAQTY